MIKTSAINSGINGLLFQAADYADDSWMPFHAHEYAHFVFSLKGKVTQVCRKRTQHLEPRSLTFLPMGEPHSCHFHEGVRTFQIVMEPQWLERVPQASPLLNTPVDYKSGLPIGLVIRLYREFQQQDNLTTLMLEGLMLELLAVMSRYATNSATSPLPRWLRQTRDLLHDRFMESLSLDEIAATVGVHPAHLMESFRQHFHCTLGNYVRRLRVESAAHLLTTSDMPASQIAHAVGFADQSHFCRTFKHLTGMTPTQFQKAAECCPSLRQEVLP